MTAGQIFDHCADDLPLDYFRPGHWVHEPVVVQQVTASHSMGEPDTIQSGWTDQSLGWLWFSMAGGSVIVSLGLAWLPWRTSCVAGQTVKH